MNRLYQAAKNTQVPISEEAIEFLEFAILQITSSVANGAVSVYLPVLTKDLVLMTAVAEFLKDLSYSVEFNAHENELYVSW